MGSGVESGGVSGVPGLERRTWIGMGLGEGSQAPCTGILNSFNAHCGLIPCQVVGMMRTTKEQEGKTRECTQRAHWRVDLAG